MKRFSQVLSLDALAKALLGVASIALIRYMPVEEYAALTFAVTVATIAGQVLAAGFNRTYILGFDSLRLGERTGVYLGAQLWLLAGLTAAAVPVALVLEVPYPYVVALAAGTLLSEFAKSYFQRQLAFGRYSVTELWRSTAQAAGIGVLIVLFGGGLGAEAVLAVQAAALIGVFMLTLGRLVDWGQMSDLAATRALLGEVVLGRYAPLLLYFSVVTVFSQIDILMLKPLADEQQLASYGSAFRYYALLMLALAAAHAVLLPAVQQARDAATLDRLYGEHFRALALFAPAVFISAWLSGWVLPWIDQGRYPDAVPVFRILCASAVISFACSPYANVLMKLHRFGIQLYLLLGGLVIAVALHLLLIPKAGAVGAAWATLIASASVTVPVSILARRFGKRLGQQPS